MTILTAVFLCALTRAELIERFRAPVVTKVDGLVRVYANCPADMRRDYQLPVAGFVADVCRALAPARRKNMRKFAEPGIVVYIGDERTNRTDVIVREGVRDDGSRVTRIYLPAPGFADREKLRLAAGRAFFRAVTGETFDEPAVRRALRDTDPLLRAADDRRDLVRWREEGVYTEGRGDEDYLKLQRKVLTPGRAAPEDVAVFASRLYLYPPYFCLPFAGVHDRCTFDEAIALAHRDAIVRYAALRKMMELSLFGGGRGERMTAAVDAYVAFLRALALGQATDAELTALLADADGKLKGVLEK
jgi:hypothetical protein